MAKVVKKEHLKDIDFRTREERQKNAITEFKLWYNELAERAYDERTAGQLTMISSVLWYLLPEKEYKKLTKRGKNGSSTRIHVVPGDETTLRRMAL